MGSGGGGAGWRGVTGAWFRTSATGAESSQALRTSFWKDKFLPQLQVGATTSWKSERGGVSLGESGPSHGFLQQGWRRQQARGSSHLAADISARVRLVCVRAGEWDTMEAGIFLVNW